MKIDLQDTKIHEFKTPCDSSSSKAGDRMQVLPRFFLNPDSHSSEMVSDKNLIYESFLEEVLLICKLFPTFREGFPSSIKVSLFLHINIIISIRKRIILN